MTIGKAIGKAIGKPKPKTIEEQFKDLDKLLRAVVPEGEPSLVLEWASSQPEAFRKILRESPRMTEAKQIERLLFEPPEVVAPSLVPEPEEYFVTPEGRRLTRAEVEAEFIWPTEFVPPRVTAEGQAIYPLETETALAKIYPDMTMEAFGTYIEETPEEFVRDVIPLGRTPEVETLLRSVGATSADIEELFPAPTVFKEEGWIKDNIIDPLYLGGVNFLHGIKTTVTSLVPSLLIKRPVGVTREEYPGPKAWYDWQEKVSRNIVRDSQERYIRYVDQHDKWIAGHKELAPKPEYSRNPFKNPELFRDPGYYANTISSSIAYSLSVMGTIGTVTAATGGNVILGIGAGMAVAGAPEASDMTRELMDMGIPFEEATEWGTLYGAVAGGVESVTNLPLLGIFFKPIKQATKPFWDTLLHLTANRILKASIVAGVIPSVEGMEEAVTQSAHNAIIKHYDETQSILEGVDVAFIQGVIASLPFAALGGGASFKSFKEALPPETQTKIEGLMDGFEEAGATEEQAEVMATNEIAKTPEGERVIDEALGEVTPRKETLREEYRKLEIAPPPVEEVKPEVFMTREQWEAMPQSSRAKALSEAGLAREISEKGWDALTALEREALIGEVLIKPDAPLTPEQRTSILELATSKLMMTEEGKVKPPLRNLMKGLVGKTKLDKLTQSEAETITEALGLLEVKYGKPPKIPTTVGLITKEFADKIPHLKEIGIIEKVRPTRQVFEKMGLRAEVFEPTFKAEVAIYEDLQAFRKEANETKKLVGKDPERRRLIFRELENPGSQIGLTFNEKRAINWFRKYFDDWADKLNLPQDKRRENYVTHIFEAEISQELKGKHPLDPALIKALDFITPKRIFNPYLQQRLGQTIGLKEDPFAAASAYEARALKVYHYEPLIQKIRVYEKYLPPNSARYLRNFINRITGRPLTIDRELNQTLTEFSERVKTLPGGEALAEHLTRGNAGGLAAYQFTSALYFLWLGFKPTSAIRNLSQHTLIIAEVGPINFAEGIRLRFTEEGKSAQKENLVLRSRRQAIVPGIDASFASRWTDKFRETALWMFRGADKQNVSDGFLAGYAEMKRLFPEAGRGWWIKRGNEVAADTQYIYTQMGGAAWSQNAIGRALSVLTTWPENWVELMTRFVKGRPSYVIREYTEATGKPIPETNWLMKRQALLLYVAIVAMGFLIKEETRLKAWEYTGLTSLRYLADLAGGEFPALQYPGALADLIVGFLTDDERRLKTGWANLKPVNLMGIIRSLDSVVAGEKDWMTLFFYLEGKDYKIKQLKERWAKDLKDYPIFEMPEDKTKYIKEHPEQAGWSDAKIRNQWREDNPLLEAKMFVTGQFTTLSTDKARAEVLRLIEEHKLDPELIDGYEKVFGIDTSVELTKFKNRLGQYEKLVIGEEAEYFTTNDFASEVNRLEKIMGRYKIEKDGNPLAMEYLRAKDQWEPYYDLEETEGRKLYRQQFPELEAQLYLWGKIGSFENPKSAEILLGLMKKYDIPPGAIRAFLNDPSKYDELFTQKFKLEQKWFDLTTEYENYGNAESPIYIEDPETRKKAREKLKVDNPNWVADMRRIEAIDHEATPEIIEKWVERGREVDEFGAGSSEAMVWLLDNPDAFKWALDQELLTDDGSDWNEQVLRINAKWRKRDDYYDTLETPEARQDYLERHDEYRKDRRRREAYGDGFDEALIEKFVDYWELPITGYRQERFLLESAAFANAMQLIKGIEIPEKVPSVKYDELLEKIHRTPEDERRMKAYKIFVPEKHIESYVEYYSLEKPEGVDLWYEDDWFMMEHQDFYKEVYLGILKNDRKDYRKIPSREVFKKYEAYQRLPLGKARDDYRFDNQDLDAWLVRKFDYTPITEQIRREELTPLEELREQWAGREEEISEIEERLKALPR